MKIIFEIKESLANLIDQLENSHFWESKEIQVDETKKIIKIKDFAYPQEAIAEITKGNILIRTALSKYIYHIYESEGSCWCEYDGAYRGFLEQKLLPVITPKENLLDQEVTSSLLGDVHKPLREYAIDNLKLKRFRQETFGDIGFSTNDHPKCVEDAFIKEDYVQDENDK